MCSSDRLRRSRRPWHLLLGLAAMGPTVALAQDAQQVSVWFDLRDPAFINLIPTATRAAMELQLSGKLSTLCGERIPFWTFAPGGAATHPRLELWLEQGHAAWELRLALRLDARPLGSQPWRTDLFPPAEIERLGGLPPSAAWPQYVRRAADKLFMEQASEILGQLRQLVPVATQIAPLGPQPPQTEDAARAVLGMGWDGFCRFARSGFRIVYERPTHELVVIHSVGVGFPADFTPQTRLFRGLIVRHTTWEDSGGSLPLAAHLTELGQLRPLAIYLESPRDDPIACTTGGPLPTLAPAGGQP